MLAVQVSMFSPKWTAPHLPLNEGTLATGAIIVAIGVVAASLMARRLADPPE
jgi:hypothetical protein